MEARLAALNARYLAERSQRPGESQITQQEIEHIQERPTYERDRLSKLMLAAPRDGRFTIPEASDPPAVTWQEARLSVTSTVRTSC